MNKIRKKNPQKNQKICKNRKNPKNEKIAVLDIPRPI